MIFDLWRVENKIPNAVKTKKKTIINFKELINSRLK